MSIKLKVGVNTSQKQLRNKQRSLNLGCNIENGRNGIEDFFRVVLEEMLFFNHTSVM